MDLHGDSGEGHERGQDEGEAGEETGTCVAEVMVVTKTQLTSPKFEFLKNLPIVEIVFSQSRSAKLMSHDIL